MKPPSEDLKRRRPVWEVLSDMFLDTELQVSDHDRIASRLIESEYTLEEIREILMHEVFPVCIPNLHSPAGEWAGIDLDWIEQKVLTRRRSRWLDPLIYYKSYWMIRRHWRAIVQIYKRDSTEHGGPFDAAVQHE